jgi:hypothetical protein
MDELSDEERVALQATRRRADQLDLAVGPRAAEDFLMEILCQAKRRENIAFAAEIAAALEDRCAASRGVGVEG